MDTNDMAIREPAEGPGFARILISALIGAVLTLGVMLLLALIMSSLGIGNIGEYPVTLFAVLLGAFFASFLLTGATTTRRLFYSVVCGILFFLVLFIVSLLFGGSERIDWTSVLISFAASLAGAIIGTIVRINSSAKRRIA